MFKKLSLFLVLVLVIGALSACTSSGVGTSELSDSKKEEIVRAWVDKRYPLNWKAKAGNPCSIQYLGTFDGFEVFQWYHPDSQNGAKGRWTTDGVDFYGNYKTDILALAGSDLEHIGNLRVYKRISHDAVVQIAQAHADGVSLSISKKLKKSIEDAWLTRVAWKWISDPEDRTLGCRYYGRYNGYDIFFYQGSGFAADVVASVEIAGEKFACGNPFDLYGYRNGQIYELKKLYEDGKISAKSLAAMAETHKTWFSYMYE